MYILTYWGYCVRVAAYNITHYYKCLIKLTISIDDTEKDGGCTFNHYALPNLKQLKLLLNSVYHTNLIASSYQTCSSYNFEETMFTYTCKELWLNVQIVFGPVN